MKTNIEAVADRAEALIGLMDHGQAVWQACQEAEFPEAELPGMASVVSGIVTQRELNRPMLPDDHEARHGMARALVAEWARAMGRTGGGHKQCRQGKIRKLMANGLNSAYAARMRKEIAEATH